MRGQRSWCCSLRCNGIKQTGPLAAFEEGAFQEVTVDNRRFCGLLLNGGKKGVPCATVGTGRIGIESLAPSGGIVCRVFAEFVDAVAFVAGRDEVGQVN